MLEPPRLERLATSASVTPAPARRSRTPVGVASHVERFRDGGSFLIPRSAYERFVQGKPFAGSPGGQFVTTPKTLDNVLRETGGDLASVKQRLGIPNQYWNEELLRIDVHNPLLHNARMPSGLEPGANDLFRFGGYTSGGLPEVVLDRIPRGGVHRLTHRSGSMKVLEHDEEAAFELIADGGNLLMVVLCGGIGLYEVKFHLDPDERAAYDARGVAYLRDLADDVRRNEPQFRRRAPTQA